MKTCSECNAAFQQTNNRQLACLVCKTIRAIRIKRERRQQYPELQKRCREATARYRNKNRDRVLQYYKDYYQKNIETKRQYGRDYQNGRRQCVDYCQSMKEYAITYREKFGQEINSKSRQRYATDGQYRQQCLDNAKRWSRANPERVIENRKEYYKKNYERFTAYNLTRHSREPIDKKLVSEIYQEGNFTCVYCGQYGGKITIDHKIPVSRGGKNNKGNLCVACHRCNCSKGAKTVEEFLIYLEEIKC